MSNKKSRLGRGIDDLVPAIGLDKLLPVENIEAGVPLLLDIDKLAPNPNQPRKDFNEKELLSLSQSIKSKGIIEPLVVARQDYGKYYIIAGERRLRAAKLANLDKVPVIIRENSDDPADGLILALLENLCREDLNPIEEALSFQRLEKEFGRTHQEIAQMSGRERPTITNSVRLLKLADVIQDDIRFGRLSAGHGRAILSLADDSLIQQLRTEIITKKLTVRQTELLVKKLNRRTSNKNTDEAFDDRAYYQSLSKNISKQLNGLKVKIDPSGRLKKLEISYQSNEELEWLLAKMGIKLND